MIRIVQSAENVRSMRATFEKLTALHRSVDPSDCVRPVMDRLVLDPTTDKPVRDSYIPFVGPFYPQGRVLICGTAQNLAKVAKSENVGEWRRATGLPAMPLHRLYRVRNETVGRPLVEAEVRFSSIAIQPYMDGILAGVAGMALLAIRRERLETLDQVTQHVAVTNFFKHSLRNLEGNDLNPSQLTATIQDRYRSVTLKRYVLEELSILKPLVVIAFSDIVADEIRASWKAGPVYRVNDPAWIKRGGSFPSGSQVPDSVADLIRGYISQMKQPYQSGKSAAATTYLAKYYADFSSGV